MSVSSQIHQIGRGFFVVLDADNMRKRINVNKENAQTDKISCERGYWRICLAASGQF